MKKQAMFIFTIVTLFGLGLFAINATKKKAPPTSQKISVVTTLFPQYDFTRQIGRDKVNVTLLLPPGVESHAYEPKPSDMARINNAQIFIYTGALMEPWAQDILNGTHKKVLIVDASQGVRLLESEEHHDDAAHEEESGHDHSPDGVDPHIWLDFENASLMATTIAKALVKTDPENAGYYQKNLHAYQKQLNTLDSSYKKTIATCKTKTIIYGGHYAFGYLASRYGLIYSAAQGFSPDAEPTAKDVITLIDQVKKNNIRFIFYEELSSPKIANTLASETDAQLLLLNGAHNLSKNDYTSGATFLSLMRSNLDNLRRGLECK